MNLAPESGLSLLGTVATGNGARLYCMVADTSSNRVKVVGAPAATTASEQLSACLVQLAPLEGTTYTAKPDEKRAFEPLVPLSKVTPGRSFFN